MYNHDNINLIIDILKHSHTFGAKLFVCVPIVYFDNTRAKSIRAHVMKKLFKQYL